MDALGGFKPDDTTGFIAVQAIRLKKWGQARAKAGFTMSCVFFGSFDVLC